MRETHFFFHAEEKSNDAARALPGYGDSFLAPHTSLRADAVFSYGEEEAEQAAILTERILDELCAPSIRKDTGDTIYSKPLLEMLCALCAEYPEVKMPAPPYPNVPLSVYSPSLFFCFGTVIHHALAVQMALRVTVEEDFGHLHISLRVPRPARSGAEAAAHLGLIPERLAVLQGIADASSFSLSLAAGEDSALTLTLPIAVATRLCFHATDGENADLLAAFLLPLRYFTY